MSFGYLFNNNLNGLNEKFQNIDEKMKTDNVYNVIRCGNYYEKSKDSLLQLSIKEILSSRFKRTFYCR